MTNDHFSADSLEEFTASLADAGFQLDTNSDPQRWRGRIHTAFASLTDATTMDIVIAPGWPFQPPALFVQGLNTNHSTIDGLVCMWREGDLDPRWTTLEGLHSRIEEWCENAKNGWENDSLDQDAFLNFHPKIGLVATLDLETLGILEHGWGEFHGVINANPPRIDIRAGRKSLPNQLRGLWFHAGQLQTPPPRRFSEIHHHLRRHQRKGLLRALDDRRTSTSNGVDIVLFCWQRQEVTDLLMIACKGTGDEMTATALQPGPNDESSLMLRAGSDATALRSCKAVVFGAGALGGYAATLLAESGVGSLDLIDPDVLLPGNVVRHIAGHDQVGAYKVDAVQAIIEDHVPWARLTRFQESPRTPAEIRQRTRDASIVVDTTGNKALTYSLAALAADTGVPLVSGALYRGGFIGRVQRQVLERDTPIHLRDDIKRYPPILAGEDSGDFAASQLGCSAPINNAPPAAVAACASLIAQSAIDVLTDRFDLADELKI